ncbi:RNA polymerase I associated factor, A49-like protein, partial [Zychaea mexicana]|uniref:RNA polymerase I associated factor, A49-like protein n=1 Tax=Zychaea mexicana TaxID=64656 RepID=UPI0022FF0DA0
MGKRKHSETTTSEGKSSKSSRNVKIAVEMPPEGADSPYLAAFPGTKPPTTTPFTSYRSRDKSSDKKRVVVGETDKVTFTGKNHGEDAPESYCQYLVGVYSKSKNTVTLTPAPVLRMHRSVKTLALSDNTIRNKQTAFNEAKTSLGLAFGTAKAKKQLKDDERNAVRGEQVQDALHDMHREIGESSTGPTQAEIKQAMQAELPIPAHNMDAASPQECYAISSIVTEEELLAMPVKELITAKPQQPKDLNQFLPFGYSKFVNERILHTLKASGKVDRPRLRVLMYISYLMAYLNRIKPFDLKNRRKVETVMKNPPNVILDQLADRYTTNDVRTPFMQDKILCYMMVLCLSVADYQLNPDLLASDLSLKPL